MPGCIYVCIEVLLSGLASADTVARVIIRKDVAVDASAKTDVETAHLPEVNRITMGEEHRESGRTKESHLNGNSQSDTNSSLPVQQSSYGLATNSFVFKSISTPSLIWNVSDSSTSVKILIPSEGLPSIFLIKSIST